MSAARGVARSLRRASSKVAKPDEAIIVTSRQRTPKEREQNHEKDNVGQKVVFGSRVFVKPIVEAYFKLSLRSRQLNVQATAQTRDAITIRVNAVAVVKVGGSESMVRAAAQRFLNQQDQIESSTEEVLSGSVRSIVGQLTPPPRHRNHHQPFGPARAGARRRARGSRHSGPADRHLADQRD